MYLQSLWFRARAGRNWLAWVVVKKVGWSMSKMCRGKKISNGPWSKSSFQQSVFTWLKSEVAKKSISVWLKCVVVKKLVCAWLDCVVLLTSETGHNPKPFE
jgi:hypothetical protein